MEIIYSVITGACINSGGINGHPAGEQVSSSSRTTINYYKMLRQAGPPSLARALEFARTGRIDLSLLPHVPDDYASSPVPETTLPVPETTLPVH